MKRPRFRKRLVVALALASATFGVQATEGNGLGVYPDGLENYLVGALPPPGVHFLTYAGTARYDTLRGASGQSLVPDLSIRVNVLAPRAVWVTQQQVLGGQLAFHAIAPLLDVDFRAGALRASSRGLGDITVGTAVGYHASPSLHYLFGVDVSAPTGQYNANDPSSLGKNYWMVQPLLAVTQVQPAGLNADLKLMLDLNGRNDDTRTRSGRALHADYSAGWGLGNGWVLGVGGHVFQQISEDSGPASGTGKARAIGFGPSVRYANDKGWLFTLKWQTESHVRNRPEGSQLYVKATLPF